MFGLSRKADKQLWNAFFSSNVEIEGSLRFTGLLNIDGRLKGAIVAKGMLVTGTSAVIEGDVYVENLVVSGSVLGNIYATGEVHLNQTAVVKGNINYHSLSIVPGAVHEGNSHLFTDEERVELTERIQSEMTNIERPEEEPEDKKSRKKAVKEEKPRKLPSGETAASVLSGGGSEQDANFSVQKKTVNPQLNVLNDSTT
ncbi:MAG: polymer-forming cytoskeletal protein [Deltaproteobacteria bacterium]|jgi:cytoskeletal protein CcmA (bactofilin family)|nr:polymer-forming cytoskeletal protein [Deltaproteobacteria bacterium]